MGVLPACLSPKNWPFLQELESELIHANHKLESLRVLPVQTSISTFELPATNKVMAQKIEAYHEFLGKYLVNSSLQKYEALEKAESDMTNKYNMKIQALKEKYSFLLLDNLLD